MLDFIIFIESYSMFMDLENGYSLKQRFPIIFSQYNTFWKIFKLHQLTTYFRVMNNDPTCDKFYSKRVMVTLIIIMDNLQ